MYVSVCVCVCLSLWEVEGIQHTYSSCRKRCTVFGLTHILQGCFTVTGASIRWPNASKITSKYMAKCAWGELAFGNRCYSFLVEQIKPIQITFSSSIRAGLRCDTLTVIRCSTPQIVALALRVFPRSTKIGGHYLWYKTNVKTVITFKHCTWRGNIP